MEKSFYSGKIEVVKDKNGSVILQIETLDHGLEALMDELKNDVLFEHYEYSGLYELKKIKFIPKDEDYVINRFYFKYRE